MHRVYQRFVANDNHIKTQLCHLLYYPHAVIDAECWFGKLFCARIYTNKYNTLRASSVNASGHKQKIIERATSSLCRASQTSGGNKSHGAVIAVIVCRQFAGKTCLRLSAPTHNSLS